MKHKYLLWLCALCVFVGCQYPKPDYSEWDLSPEESDSIRFVENHQYTINYNFAVCADSLGIAPLPSDTDSVYLRRNDLVVVADYAVFPEDSIDSIYIKVARDQQTIGWLHESNLLAGVTPDDPISQFIHFFSGTHTLYFLIIIGLAVLFYLYRMSRKKKLQIVHFNDVDSPYPTLLCMLVASAATFYGGIQHYVPATWIHYYYYPTLNPFALPLGMGCFIGSVWGIFILSLAVLDDLYHKLPLDECFTYLLGLGAICTLCYIFFTLVTPHMIGYPLLVLYLAFAILRCDSFRSYRCGACGGSLPHQKGVCPHCGAVNA